MKGTHGNSKPLNFKADQNDSREAAAFFDRNRGMVRGFNVLQKLFRALSSTSTFEGFKVPKISKSKDFVLESF